MRTLRSALDSAPTVRTVAALAIAALTAACTSNDERRRCCLSVLCAVADVRP
jgi:hypothetical protein